MRIRIRPFEERIICAFVYGSIVRREEPSTSDVDLMVIGNTGLPDLAPVYEQPKNDSAAK